MTHRKELINLNRDFDDYHLQRLAKRVKSFVKYTNYFLSKLDCLNLPKDALFLNMSHYEGILTVKEGLMNRDDQTIFTESLMELVEIVLKNNIFEHEDKFQKQNQGFAKGTKMTPSYAIPFMDVLEKGILDGSELKPPVLWHYIDNVFFLEKTH